MPARSAPCALLLDDASEEVAALGVRLTRMGVGVERANGAEDARERIAAADPPIPLLVAPARIDLAEAKKTLELLTERVAPGRPAFMIVGEQPEGAWRSPLREAGVTWVLWAPFDDNELRFLVSSAMARPESLSARKDTRIPANLSVWIRAGSRRDVGVLSNLSARGAYIELAEPLPVGASMRIEFELPPERFRLFARVVHSAPDANGSPLLRGGVGVCFDPIDNDTARLIRETVEERAARYLP
jgi:hypothetical protein